MKILLRQLLAVAFVALISQNFLLAQNPSVAPEKKMVVSLDEKGVAMKGYDPVSYFSPDAKPVPGDSKFAVLHGGATYHFANAENKAAFEKDPAKYAPQFGGYCAYGVSEGHLAPTDPLAFQIVGGKLYLQYSPEVVALFAKDVPGNLAKAEKSWTTLGFAAPAKK